MSDPTLLVLSSLAGGDKHGYAMMEDIEFDLPVLATGGSATPLHPPDAFGLRNNWTACSRWSRPAARG
jgi:hypothetical protein